MNQKLLTVFEKMNTPEVREAFLSRKEASYNIGEESFSLLKNYILSDKCQSDIQRLMDNDFFFSVPCKTYLRKKNSQKKRIIYRFLPEEKMLMQLMAFVLHDYDDIYEDSVYSFRIGKHISQIFSSVRKRNLSTTHWVIKTDIRSYGDNVDPKLLSEMLDEIFMEKDPVLCTFFRKILMRGEFSRGGILENGSTGALSGCPLTTFFENVYLRDVDKYIMRESSFYCRYADDIAIFVETEEHARSIYANIKELFAERGLSFNEEKTAILAPGEGFDLLGFHVEGNEFDISEHSLNSIIWRLNHRAKKLVRLQSRYGLSREETMQKMINKIDEYFFGRDQDNNELNWVDWSFNVLTRCDSLNKIDSCAQECIRYVGSGGKRNNAKYRVRYKSMQKMGYRTLVHAFYHGVDDNCVSLQSQEKYHAG
jgi:retron-type reverse transcriptase